MKFCDNPECHFHIEVLNRNRIIVKIRGKKRELNQHKYISSDSDGQTETYLCDICNKAFNMIIG